MKLRKGIQCLSLISNLFRSPRRPNAQSHASTWDQQWIQHTRPGKRKTRALDRIVYQTEGDSYGDGEITEVRLFIRGVTKSVAIARVTHFHEGGIRLDALEFDPLYHGADLEPQLIGACKAWWPGIDLSDPAR